jgi:hypothetical protein
VVSHEGRLFRNGGEAPYKGLATKPEAGRERIITVLGHCPSHSTNWPGAAEAGRAVRVVLLELELAGRVEYLADRIALCASANET